MYTIRVDAKIRNKLVYFLKDKGVGASVHFAPPVHCHPFYLENFPARFPLPNAEELSDTIVTLPMFPTLTEAMIEYIVSHLTDFFHSNDYSR